MIADVLKQLRARKGVSQAELSKRLNITRSSVNAWEMGISVPSVQYLLELANFFGVSVDYLLGQKHETTMSISGLSEKEVGILTELAEYFREQRSKENFK